MRFLLLSLMAILLAACQTGDVRVLRKAGDASDLREDEQRIWYAAGQLADALRKQGQIYQDAELRDYVQRITDRLYPEFAGVLKVRVLKSGDMNAFSLPNGGIYLNLGLIARMRNEAQLATVIAHEVSHFKFQHGLRKRHAADSFIVAGWVVSLASGIPLSGELMALGAVSGYSQDAEREADREGFKRLVTSGYDISQAPVVFEIMRAEAKALKVKRPWLYVSHPALGERVETLRKLVAEQGDLPKGVRDTERFEQLIPPLRMRLLRRLLIARHYKPVIYLLEDEASRAGFPSEAGCLLADAYLQRNEKGDDERALAAYRRVARAVPEFAPTYRGLGLLMMHRDQPEQAIIHLRHYLALAPDAPDRAYIERYLNKLNESR